MQVLLERKKKNHSIDPGNVHRGRRQHKDIQGGPGIKGASCKDFKDRNKEL